MKADAKQRGAVRFTVARTEQSAFGSLDPAISPVDGDSRTRRMILLEVTYRVERRHLSLPITVLKELR
ncbi:MULTISPECIES: hypothetical protein [Xanthomonas]|uniref:Uncharacterized protein n=1 Tax=Xanthomonas campestris pv. phaseoli TaxID=317013 RepID=A0A7Z7NKH1_XANCH|nr:MULTISPECIES: hypothetical protein [Xanthomonas]QTD87983.1 hypothetical protein XcfCFBP6988P_23360 [Xanthomonas citri pv. phaseoli var. fuscans]QTF14064.1 hypothetical protein XcfCFBP6989P_23275 [Xanthomonas citri pv. phaseoli var. fuscans]QTF14287.1 hypothetical protein XcfCFBP6991P_24005 [Xanthomonas citri pv. phaseoli var. fuscans]QTF76260.1 hypothetical protein XcfCFBP6990P_23305 [Xanthomonas citri pv. phaseoli var. fuscans]UZA99819.1 hypothetical protein OM946_00700 [Xanthomonas citri 